MKKILLAAVLSMMTWTGIMAQDVSDADYQAALAAITDGGTYCIKTNVSGTDYYVTTDGGLTSAKDNAGCFTITKTSGGYFGTGFRIDNGTERFTNPPLGSGGANLKPGNFVLTIGDRVDWERQILYLNSEGKYAIRSCNCADGTSGWNDAARTHWTTYWVDDIVTPCYTYDKAYDWDIEALTTVNVTYKLVESDGTTVVGTETKIQSAYSSPVTPLPLTGSVYNGFWHEKFCYDYAVSGTIGDTDCTITIVRTMKAVTDLSELSNDKVYNIGCDRGAMVIYNGSMVSTALNDATVNAQPLGRFSIINDEDKYYLYSVDEGKFVTNTGALVDDLINDGHGEKDAIVMTKQQAAPYFLWSFNTDNAYLNTNGNTPRGYVINSYSTPDAGNQYYLVPVDDFDPAYTVTYVIKDVFGNVLFTSEPQITKSGARITNLPAAFHRQYYTYNAVDVTIADFETTIEFTATWNGPFDISADFATAHWYDLVMRGTWYMTSAIKDGDGAYKPQDANTMDLVEDSYQWAFIGDGYNGFKVINKAEGDGKSFGWTDAQQTNGGVPTIMDDSEGNHLWKIVASTCTTVPANPFCLNVPGTNLYVNQYGGASGSMKFWDSASNIDDQGSAFNVYEVSSSFLLTLTASGNGVISYDNTSVRSSSQSFDVADFSDVVLTVTPDAGHHVETLTINGEDALSRLTDDGKLPLTRSAAIGTWTFDNPSDLLAGTGIATLQATTHAKGIVTVTDLATAGITSVNGPDADNGAVNVPIGSSLLMAANNNATSMGSYSIMYDVSVEDGSPWIPLLQNSLTDSKDASLFIHNNAVGLGSLGYHGSIENGKWYRIVFVVEPNGASLYVDGIQVASNLNLTAAYNQHWLLKTGALFFADEDGEETAIKISELRFWDVALTADEVGMLGACGSVASSYGGMTSSVTVAVTFANNSDLNDDGLVDVSDIMTIINNIADDIYLAAADLNNDGFVDVGDIMVVINAIIGIHDNTAGVKAMRDVTNLMPATENDDYLTISNEDNIVSIQLDNEYEYSAFQMLVTLPDGVDIEDVIFNSNRLNGFTQFARKVNERQYIIIGFSMDGNVITGSAGKILSIGTTGNADDNIVISDPIFSIPDAKSYKLRVDNSFTTNLQDIQVAQISVRGNTVYVHANNDTMLNIYSVSGALCEQKRLHPGVNAITLRPGQYIINNRKVTITN